MFGSISHARKLLIKPVMGRLAKLKSRRFRGALILFFDLYFADSGIRLWPSRGGAAELCTWAKSSSSEATRGVENVRVGQTRNLKKERDISQKSRAREARLLPSLNRRAPARASSYSWKIA